MPCCPGITDLVLFATVVLPPGNTMVIPWYYHGNTTRFYFAEKPRYYHVITVVKPTTVFDRMGVVRLGFPIRSYVYL